MRQHWRQCLAVFGVKLRQAVGICPLQCPCQRPSFYHTTDRATVNPLCSASSKTSACLSLKPEILCFWSLACWRLPGWMAWIEFCKLLDCRGMAIDSGMLGGEKPGLQHHTTQRLHDRHICQDGHSPLALGVRKQINDRPNQRGQTNAPLSALKSWNPTLCSAHGVA